LIAGVGTDIIEIQRIEDALAHTEGLKQRLFTSREIAYCESMRRPAMHFAARFAAKESVFKAMGTGWRGGIRFDEIEIVNDQLGRPELVLHGKAKEWFEANRISGTHVSLSHIRELAQAFVVLERAG
jgi:holo-[acyl-carrier protein] synthase